MADYNIRMKVFNQTAAGYDQLFPQIKANNIIDTIPISQGGTNATTPSQALENLGANPEALVSDTAPTTSTVGVVGQNCIVGDAVYQCVSIVTNGSSTSYVWVRMLTSADASLTRGPVIFNEDGVFDAALYGLKIGSPVTVVVVGGGQGSDGSSTKSGAAAGKGGAGGNGGGGGGGGGYGAGGGGSASTSGYGSSGGSAGGLSIGTVYLNSLSTVVTVGAGSDGGAIDTEANPGGDSSFGDLLVAGGGGSSTTSITATGGAGGGRGSRCGGGGGGGFVFLTLPPISYTTGKGGDAGSSSNGEAGTSTGGGGGAYNATSPLYWSGGAGGPNGGGRGGDNYNSGTKGEDGIGTGNGVVMVWY